jgi:DNA polymerase III subunit gamma/tau
MPSSCSTRSMQSSPAIRRAPSVAAARLADSGWDAGQLLRDLEVHGRELLAVQVLGDVRPELQVTPERDIRLAEQATASSDTNAIRLLDLVSAALDATANGAEARIQLELVLVKAAAPELDPAMSALLARIERLERGGSSGGGLRAAPATEATPPPPRRTRHDTTGPLLRLPKPFLNL